MKSLLTNSLYVLALAFLAGLVSCKSLPEEEVKEHKVEHMEPSEWVPDDPELLAGKKVYSVECGLCHDEGEEAAPRLADTDQWSKREAKGVAVLVEHAINGFVGDDGEMPARAGNPDLTDEEITQAVKFMLAAFKK